MTTDLIISGNQTPTMSSREIAELVEKQHKHVLRDIEAMLAQITEPNFGLSDFLSSYIDSTGRSLKEYRLPKDLTITLVTGYRADLRYRVVKRLEQLEDAIARPALPDFTDPDVLQVHLLASINRERELKKQVAVITQRANEMQKDVKTFELICKAEGSVTLSEAAKILECRTKGAKGLPVFMYSKGFIHKTGSKWCASKGGLTKGYVEEKLNHFTDRDGEDKVSAQARVTALGLSVLSKMHDLPRIKSPSIQPDQGDLLK